MFYQVFLYISCSIAEIWIAFLTGHHDLQYFKPKKNKKENFSTFWDRKTENSSEIDQKIKASLFRKLFLEMQCNATVR